MFESRALPENHPSSSKTERPDYHVNLAPFRVFESQVLPEKRRPLPIEACRQEHGADRLKYLYSHHLHCQAPASRAFLVQFCDAKHSPLHA